MRRIHANPDLRRVTTGWGQLWNLGHIAGVRIVSQTTSLLFAKTLVRKDNISVAPPSSSSKKKGNDGATFAHKAQILTLMSQDVHRVADLSKHVYALTGSRHLLADRLLDIACSQKVQIP